MTKPKATAEELPPAHPYTLARVQELWYALQARSWLSLAIVPSHPGSGSRELARALTEVGSALRGEPVHLFDAEHSDSDAVVKLMVDVRAYTRDNERVVIALDPPVINPTAISLIRAADAALLTIERGRADLRSARKTIELVGPDRLVGSVLVQAR
ncbi:MAG: hypothetical protein JST54_26485 [Deltaproteobacteria bacterium]|nr:hypothetical protein [Deltaproteobacteria bacterium]